MNSEVFRLKFRECNGSFTSVMNSNEMNEKTQFSRLILYLLIKMKHKMILHPVPNNQ